MPTPDRTVRPDTEAAFMAALAIITALEDERRHSRELAGDVVAECCARLDARLVTIALAALNLLLVDQLSAATGRSSELLLERTAHAASLYFINPDLAEQSR